MKYNIFVDGVIFSFSALIKYTFLYPYTFIISLSTEWKFIARLSTARDIY